MSFKDDMIEAEERGFTTPENSYEYVREQMADAADLRREAAKENPPVFMVGDHVIWDDGDEQGAFHGVVTKAEVGKSYVIVKLDAGGVYTAERRHLRRV